MMEELGGLRYVSLLGETIKLALKYMFVAAALLIRYLLREIDALDRALPTLQRPLPTTVAAVVSVVASSDTVGTHQATALLLLLLLLQETK